MYVDPDPRVILHFDADAFYAQVEELRDSSLVTKPLGTALSPFQLILPRGEAFHSEP